MRVPTSQKHLGVLLSDDLLWRSHASSIVARWNRSINGHITMSTLAREVRLWKLFVLSANFWCVHNKLLEYMYTSPVWNPQQASNVIHLHWSRGITLHLLTVGSNYLQLFELNSSNVSMLQSFSEDYMSFNFCISQKTVMVSSFHCTHDLVSMFYFHTFL